MTLVILAPGCGVCPDSGKTVCAGILREHTAQPMSDPSELQDIVAYLVRTTSLSHGQASRVVDDVLAFLNETPDAFVRRRHRALQAEGLANSEIFGRIRSELERLRFRAPPLSERQIRRIIYG